MYTRLLFLASIGVASAAAAPKVVCTVVTKLVTAAHQQQAATAFCSSYLSIPVITSTATSTTYTSTATSTVTTTTATVTTTSTVTTSVVTVPSTISITTCAAPTNGAKVKRGVVAKPKPSCFNSYTPGAALSSACSCLSIPPSTTTTTTTLSQVTTTTTTTSVASTSTVYTSVVGTTTSGTVSILAVPTFQVQVVGGDNNGNLLEVNDDYSPSRLVNDNGGNAGTTFSLLSNGSLVVNSGADAGRVAVEDSAQDSSDPFLVYAENAADLASASSNLVTLNCQLQTSTDGTCPLVCSANGATISYDCGVYWRLATGVPSGCFQWTPYAVGGAGT